MLVETLMKAPVACCTPEDTLDSAAAQMWQRDCGALPVCEVAGNQRVVGMVTDRDICMHAHFHHRALTELRVADAMTGNPRTCRPSDSVVVAEQLMGEAGVRRLPVVDDNGRLVGIFTLTDMALEAAREDHFERADVTEMEAGATLAAICAPRSPGTA